MATQDRQDGHRQMQVRRGDDRNLRGGRVPMEAAIGFLWRRQLDAHGGINWMPIEAAIWMPIEADL